VNFASVCTSECAGTRLLGTHLERIIHTFGLILAMKEGSHR
jgi:hypothetical protein